MGKFGISDQAVPAAFEPMPRFRRFGVGYLPFELLFVIHSGETQVLLFVFPVRLWSFLDGWRIGGNGRFAIGFRSGIEIPSEVKVAPDDGGSQGPLPVSLSISRPGFPLQDLFTPENIPFRLENDMGIRRQSGGPGHQKQNRHRNNPRSLHAFILSSEFHGLRSGIPMPLFGPRFLSSENENRPIRISPDLPSVGSTHFRLCSHVLLTIRGRR